MFSGNTNTQQFKQFLTNLTANPVPEELRATLQGYLDGLKETERKVAELAKDPFLPSSSLTGTYSDIEVGFQKMDARLRAAKEIIGVLLGTYTYAKPLTNADFETVVDTLSRTPAFKNDREFQGYFKSLCNDRAVFTPPRLGGCFSNF